MHTRLIFDIETIGIDFEKLDETSQGMLMEKWNRRQDNNIDELKQQLGFSPLTGKVAAIGILNPDTDKGAVYFISEDKKDKKVTEGEIQYVPLASEKEVLKEFWETVNHYDQLVTFNGRSFDGPFLVIRSAANKIKPTKNIMPNRYESDDYGKIITHLDLYDRLTFFGSFYRQDSVMSLHMWCQALGIESPKSEDITGKDVWPMFKERKYLDIARYCAGDLWATKELLNYWEKYINIK